GLKGVNGVTATVLVVSVSPASAKVGGLSLVTFEVLDTCSLTVPGASVTLTVVSGGGLLLSPAGPGVVTDAGGDVTAQLRLGPMKGRNILRAEVAGTPWATAYVDGTVPDEPEGFLSKNFFDPSRGEKVQVRVTVPVGVHLSVRVYNLAGELVRVVKDADVMPGLTVWDWDGRNASGALVGNGTYFIQIVSGKEYE